MAGTENTNTEFELRGFNHVAFVCRDMAETVAWYEDKLGMKLVKTLELPGGRGQHFFLDMGNGVDGIAFFWFPDAPEGIPGDSVHNTFDDQMRPVGNGVTAIGTMNHIAFDVPAEKIDEYLVKLRSKGVAVTEITNHSNSLEGGHKPRLRPGNRRRRCVRPLAVLQGPERHAARVRLLDHDVRRVRHPPRRGHRRRRTGHRLTREPPPRPPSGPIRQPHQVRRSPDSCLRPTGYVA